MVFTRNSTFYYQQVSSKIVVQGAPIGDYFVLHMLGKNLDGFVFNALVDNMAQHLSDTIPNQTNRFVRQTSKLSEIMSAVKRRASFRSESNGKTNYLQMEEHTDHKGSALI